MPVTTWNYRVVVDDLARMVEALSRPVLRLVDGKLVEDDNG